jgi:hypothetical protein
MDIYTNGHDSCDDVSSFGGEDDEDIPSKPSAKALGKRKVVELEALPDREYSRSRFLGGSVLIACFHSFCICSSSSRR